MTIKILKAALTAILCGAGILWPGCTSGSSQAPQQPTATVQRGNLTIAITASGNLALSHKEDLAFGMAGYVGQVSVKESDPIKEGQVLASLNTSEDWEAQITTLERQVTAAQRKVTAAERNLTTAQRKVTIAERQLADAQKQAPALVAAKQQALAQAEINAKSAEIALAKARGVYRSPEIDILQAELRIAEANAQYDTDSLLDAAAGARATWQRQVDRDAAVVNSVRARLNGVLPIGDEDEIAAKQNQLDIAQASLKDAQDAIPQAQEDGQRAIDDAQVALEDARTAAEDAKDAVEDAKTGADDAQKALDKAKAASPLVKAPFDGFVTVVSVNGGDQVYKGTIALQVADPTKFEADVLVSEKDFFRVKAGGAATVQLNAMSSLSYPAKVTYIAPTATVQQGVASYKVRVELQSLQAVSQNQTGQQLTPGWKPTPTTQIVHLTEGTSIIVNIVTDQRNNVLLVPNQVITTQGRQAVVTVSQNGTTELRLVKTGISDGQYTEVTDGLAEGEQVVISKATAATSKIGQATQPPRGNLVR